MNPIADFVEGMVLAGIKGGSILAENKAKATADFIEHLSSLTDPTLRDDYVDAHAAAVARIAAKAKAAPEPDDAA